MALPKMQRVFAAAAVVALLTAGAPGRAEAAGTDLAGAVADAWSSFLEWAFGSSSSAWHQPGGGDEATNGPGNGNGNGYGRPAWVPGPPDVDKGSGLDPNGGGDD